MTRDLRQGNPLSSLLFLLVAEGFNLLMKGAIEARMFNGFKFDNGEERFTHLQYADDTLIIGE